MMKKIIKGVSIVAILIAVVSCSGTKKITEQELVNAAVVQVEDELGEQKQKEDYS